MKISYSHFVKIGILISIVTTHPAVTAQQTIGQNNIFSFLPQKPNSGDQITITYSSGLMVSDSQQMYADIYFLKGAPPSPVKINLVKKQNRYEGSFEAPDSLKAVFIKFDGGSFNDNNNRNEYFIPIYKDSLLVPGAYIEIARIFSSYSTTLNIKRDLEKAAGFYLNEFEVNPEYREKYLSQFVYALRLLKKGNDTVTKHFFEELEKKKLTSEADLTIIEDYWRIIGNTTKADEIKTLVQTQFPKGLWLKKQKIKAFDSEKDLTKKTALYEEIATLFPPQTEEEKYAFDDDLTWEIMKALAIAGEYGHIPQYDARMYNADELAGVYNEIAILLIGLTTTDVSKDLVKGKQYLEKAFQIFQTIKNVKNENLDRRYYSLNRTKALIYYKEGDFMKAYETQKIVSKGFNNTRPDINESLCVYAEKALGITEAKKELELLIKTGNYTTLMKDQLKRIYLLTESEETWNEYFASFDKDYLQKFRNELLKQIVNEPAPLFVLKDLNGNKVDLKDLRGKIVVLDFWATWCGPCIKRFPGMQKTIEKYRNNPDIVFLFIDTWERVPETKREKLLNKFLKDNDFSFRVLLDERLGSDSQYRLANDFKIEGIPTKIIINKNGNIVFKEGSGSLNSDLFVEEMTIMIDITNSAK